MILDRGICTVSKRVNTAEPGRKPVYSYSDYHQSLYGELSYETAQWINENREAVRADARIRVLQDRRITNHDRVVLQPYDSEGTLTYEVTRAYHGTDPDSGELISDLTLGGINP